MKKLFALTLAALLLAALAACGGNSSAEITTRSEASAQQATQPGTTLPPVENNEAPENNEVFDWLLRNEKPSVYLDPSLPDDVYCYWYRQTDEAGNMLAAQLCFSRDGTVEYWTENMPEGMDSAFSLSGDILTIDGYRNRVSMLEASVSYGPGIRLEGIGGSNALSGTYYLNAFLD